MAVATGATAPAAAAGGAPAAAARPPPAGQQKRRRDAASLDEVMALAARLGLTGPLGVDFGASAGNGFGSSLLAAAHRRQAEAWDLPRTATALQWTERFVHASGRAPLFLPAVGTDATAGAIWNRTTLDMLGEFIRTAPPMGATKGTCVGADTAQSYVGAIRLLRSREAKYDVAPEHVDLWAPLAFKQMRRADGPPGDRALSRGVRDTTLRRAADAGFDRRPGQPAVDWAAALYAKDAYLRGGEIGVQDGATPDSRRILTWLSFTFMEPRGESLGRPWLLGRVVPIKDVDARRGGYPTPTCRRHDGPFGADPTCPYDAVALAWWCRRARAGAPFPVDGQGRPAARWWLLCEGAGRAATAPPDSSPFFTTASGAAFTTSDVRRLARSIAAAAHGVCTEEPPPGEVGAKAFRIGGATDGRAKLGDRSADVLKQRGRWQSDVAAIYQRPLLAEQLSLSGQVVPDAAGGLEDVCLGFAQAATR